MQSSREEIARGDGSGLIRGAKNPELNTSRSGIGSAIIGSAVALAVSRVP